MRRIVCLLPAICFVAACSGIRTYPNPEAKNLVVRSELSDVRAAVHIHEVEPDCRTRYQGTVKLEQAQVSIGVPAERTSYLVFSFQSSSFWSGRSTMNVGTLLKPRSGYRYEVDVKYRDDIYDVTVRELGAGKSPGRELPHRDLGSCKPS
jgi:hypothetical protein